MAGMMPMGSGSGAPARTPGAGQGPGLRAETERKLAAILACAPHEFDVIG